MTAAKGLGRGFESLIPTDLVDEEFDLTASEERGELRQLKIKDIHPDTEQPRRDFSEEALNALAASMIAFLAGVEAENPRHHQNFRLTEST